MSAHHQTVKAALYREAKPLGYGTSWNQSTIASLREFLAQQPTPEVPAPEAPVREVPPVAEQVVSLGVQEAFGHVRERFRVNEPAEFYQLIDRQVGRFVAEHGTFDADIQIVIGEGDKNRTVTVSSARYHRAGRNAEQAVRLLLDEIAQGLIPGSDIEGLDQEVNPGAFSLSGQIAGDVLAPRTCKYSFAEVDASVVGSKADLEQGKLCFYRAVAGCGLAPEVVKAALHLSKLDEFEAWAVTHGVSLTIFKDMLTGYSIDREAGQVHANTMYYPLKDVRFERLVCTSAATSRIALIVTADGKHVERLKGLRTGLWIDQRGNVVDGERKVVRRAGQVRVKSEAQKAGPELVIVSFDVETVFDSSAEGFLRVYSISWSVRKASESSGTAYFHYGWDSMQVFIDWILANLRGKRLCLLGWNSSRFDNFWVIPELMSRDLINEVKLVGGSILKATFANGSFVFDVCRYLSCPLAVACQQFQPSYRKRKELIEHSEVQSAYNREGSLDAFFGLEQGHHVERAFAFGSDGSPAKDLEIDNELILYNILDVLSCDEIYRMVDKQLRDSGMITKDLCYQATIGGMAWQLQKAHFAASKSEFSLPKLPLDKYLAIRGSMVAGRTQCHAGRFVDLSGEQEYLMYDAKSLYPFSYLNNDFPCGEIIEDDTYENCVREGRIGFFVTRFTQPDSMPCKILPLRQEGSPLNWNYSGEMEQLVSSVDLGQLIKHGAVIHEIQPGFSFSGVVHGSRLFAPMAAAKAIKEGEDRKPAAERNNVLRNMAKLIINAVSGKVVQRCFTETQVIIKSHQKINEILKNYSGVRFSFGSGGSHLISYQRPFEECYQKQAMPAFLGALIYGYARRWMTDCLLSRYPGIYQDTDSLLMTKEVADRFKAENPELVGGEFGQFELEDTKNLAIRKVIVLSPKNYFLFSDDNKLLKKGFKGVNLSRDALLTSEYVDAHPELYRRNNDGTLSFAKGVSTAQKHEEYYGSELAGKRLIKPENVFRFYEAGQAEGRAFVLCSSLRKRVDTMSVQACFQIKTIRF